MMKSVAELLGTDKAKAGYLNEADYARTVDVLMSDKTDPVITQQPVGVRTVTLFGTRLTGTKTALTWSALAPHAWHSPA